MAFIANIGRLAQKHLQVLAMIVMVLKVIIPCLGIVALMACMPGGAVSTGDYDDDAVVRALTVEGGAEPIDTDTDSTDRCWADRDGDGYGDEIVDCDDADAVDNNDDCDDSRGSVHPGATELCNTRDDDCDGSVNEGGVCDDGSDPEDCDNGRDDDGDGDVDNEDSDCGRRLLCARDEDGDGYGDETDPSVEVRYGRCDDSDVDNSNDCDDGAFTVNPGRREVCNDIDDDCDGDIDDQDSELNPGECDEQETIFCYDDLDRDGYGAGGRRTLTVDLGETCEDRGDFVDNDDDCDDSRASVNPGEDEICDNNRDDDCDGDVDEDDSECDGGSDPECGAMRTLELEVDYSGTATRRMQVQPFLRPNQLGEDWPFVDGSRRDDLFSVDEQICGESCGVRFNVDEGSGAYFCYGHRDSPGDYELNGSRAQVTIRFDGVTYDEDDLEVWSHPDGYQYGCSAILFFRNTSSSCRNMSGGDYGWIDQP